MNDIIENGHNQNQSNQLESGGSTGSSVTQSTDLLDQFSAPDLEHSNLNQVNINLNDLNDSTINLNNSNGSLDLGSININFPLTSADPNIKTVPSPKKSSSKKRKLDELAFENISDSESAGSNSSKESKCKDMKYASGPGAADYNYGDGGATGHDFLDAAASSLLDTDNNKSQDETDTGEQANNPNSNEQIYQQQQQQQQQPMSNRQPTPNRVGSPGFNHQLQSPYMMQQNGAAQIQSPGCVVQQQQQQQQPAPSPMSHQQIQSPMQAKPPTPHGNQAASASPAHYHRQFNDPNDPNFQQQQHHQPPQGPMPPSAGAPPLPPPPQPTFIHVFTTQIANEAAQSVVRQQHRSIIDFHRQMPATMDFMRNFHQHHQAIQRAPNGVPLPVPNEQLTVEQLKTRTEKLGKLKNLSSIIGIGGQMPPEPGAKRARSSNTPGQVPGSGAPSPFTNGEMYPIDQFNPMINYEPGYRMGSSPQQPQQGPPPPYGLKPKMHKAGVPEKYADKLKSGHSPSPDSLNTGLQTTPSPQLMNYFELEGQELTITKQLNLSFKSSNNIDNNPMDEKNLARPPSAQNSNIINCLNGSNNQSPAANDDQDKHKSDPTEQYQIDNEQSSSSSRKTPGINKSLSNSQLDYYQNVNSPLNNNNSQSPAMNGASGPLNQMLQMTNSIPKASPYSNAKSPGLNHPQFSGSHPQMSSSPSPIIQPPPGIPPHILMQQQQQQQQHQHQQQQQQQQQLQQGGMGPMPPIKNGKMSKKQQQQQQQQMQQQQEMMQRGMMMEGMPPPPPHGMHRPPPPHMMPPHMMNHPGMGDPRLMGPRFPPQNAPNFRPMREPDMYQNGGPPGEFMAGDYAKPPQQHRSSKSRQNEMMMMNGPPPPNMMPMMNNGKFPMDQQMYAPPPPGHHNEFANGPPRPMHPMHMGGPRPPMEPGMMPPGMMPNGMPMMRPMHPNQGPPPPPFDMPPPPHHHHHIQYQNQPMHNQQQQPPSQNSQQNYDSNNYNPIDQQNQVLPQMLQNSGNQQSQQQQQQHQLQQSQQEINSLQQQMGLGPGPGGDSLGFPDLTDPILQFGD